MVSKWINCIKMVSLQDSMCYSLVTLAQLTHLSVQIPNFLIESDNPE